MSKLHSITANGRSFPARTGEVILDAALMHGVEFPHDCRAGHTIQPRMIHACQARVLSDMELEFERMPAVRSMAAKVVSIEPRSADVVEVGLELEDPIRYRPGQYCTFKFRGFPKRSFSPTIPADGSSSENDITLHVKRVRGGLVSNALGNRIMPGHALRVEGPYGSAFYRANTTKRLVLVSGGTGFAPILSIGFAALAEDPLRKMVIVAGAKRIESLYMAPVLLKLKRFPGIELLVTASELGEHEGVVLQGDPEDHVPPLASDHAVYAAGSPAMILRLAERAREVDADFYSDPFEPNVPPPQGWFGRKAPQAPRRQAATA